MTQEEVDKINDYYNENPVEVNLDLVYDLNGTLDIFQSIYSFPIDNSSRTFSNIHFLLGE